MEIVISQSFCEDQLAWTAGKACHHFLPLPLLLFILTTIVDIFSHHCCLLLMKVVVIANNVSDIYLQTHQDRGAGWPIGHVVDYFLQKSQRMASYTRLFLSFPVCTYKQLVRKQIYPKIRISDGLLAECVAVHWKNRASQATNKSSYLCYNSCILYILYISIACKQPSLHFPLFCRLANPTARFITLVASQKVQRQKWPQNELIYGLNLIS